jgi:hypothetical protein
MIVNTKGSYQPSLLATIKLATSFNFSIVLEINQLNQRDAR